MIGPLGILAGKGRLPLEIAQAVIGQGRDVFVVRVAGLADPALEAFSGMEMNLGQLGAGMDRLRAENCRDVVFAGYMTRPDLSGLQLDDTTIALLPKVLAAAPEGDNALIEVFVSAFQEAGFDIVGAERAYPELICPEGVLTQAEPDGMATKDLQRAQYVAGIIGREDIGQACVVCNGLVLAVEAQEGTDAMLARIAGLDPAFRGEPDARRGVLVKRTKPTQERRVDLPVIGTGTVEHVAAAGLTGIGLEAGGSLIVDRAATVAAADAAGLFIIGLPVDELP